MSDIQDKINNKDNIIVQINIIRKIIEKFSIKDPDSITLKNAELDLKRYKQNYPEYFI